MEQARTLDDSHPLIDDGRAQSVPSGHRRLSTLRAIDWIWNIRGSVALPSGQTGDEAFSRLDPLFQQPGTTYERSGDALIFSKKDQAAQDKMSIYDAGVLQIEPGPGGALLRYRMSSRALLFCFLAPFLFLAFGQLIVGIGMLEGASAEVADEKDKSKKDEAIVPMHPIDKALGAPAPEKPKKDDAKESDEDDKKHSPTAAYVFAGIFAVLYVIGRLLEAWLAKSLFRKRLHES